MVIKDLMLNLQKKEKRIALLTFDLPQEVVAAARNIPCNCPRCALMKQDDFKNQKSGLEEIYRLKESGPE